MDHTTSPKIEDSDLEAEIRAFIEKHAKLSGGYDPEWDDPEDRFNGPDSSMMETAANRLRDGQSIDFYVDSSWNSGCYQGDDNARQWHDRLKARLNALRINNPG